MIDEDHACSHTYFAHRSWTNHPLFKTVEWILSLKILKNIKNGIAGRTDVENIL